MAPRAKRGRVRNNCVGRLHLWHVRPEKSPAAIARAVFRVLAGRACPLAGIAKDAATLIALPGVTLRILAAACVASKIGHDRSLSRSYAFHVMRGKPRTLASDRCGPSRPVNRMCAPTRACSDVRANKEVLISARTRVPHATRKLHACAHQMRIRCFRWGETGRPRPRVRTSCARYAAHLNCLEACSAQVRASPVFRTARILS